MSRRRDRGRRSPRWPRFLVLVVAVATACGGEPRGDPLRVVVPRGASLHRVTDTLAARGIIDGRAEPLFRAYARVRRDDREIRAGHYAFRRGESWRKILDDLTAGRVITVPLTIPEGFTIRQMAPRIAEVTGRDVDEVLAALTGDSLAARMDVPGPGLEGYLFPDTYLFEPETSTERVAETMVARYRSFWTPERLARLSEAAMTERELVTLASIIQAEARRVEEMPTISSVYHNRLRRGIPLQADPTVLYALGGHRDRLLYAAIDSVAANPYNTYRNPGLPPGPIGSPGERALEAALDPAETGFVYFVARPDGSHVFTTTLDEHNRAKAAARRAWDTARAGATVRPPLDSASAPPGGAPPP